MSLVVRMKGRYFGWDIAVDSEHYSVYHSEPSEPVGSTFSGWRSSLSDLFAIGVWYVAEGGKNLSGGHFLQDDFGNLQPLPLCADGYVMDVVGAASNYEIFAD